MSTHKKVTIVPKKGRQTAENVYFQYILLQARQIRGPFFFVVATVCSVFVSLFVRPVRRISQGDPITYLSFSWS